ncbi:MAG TPA: ABC transporter substrate-binding protein [Candidatus Binatia bacterium]
MTSRLLLALFIIFSLLQAGSARGGEVAVITSADVDAYKGALQGFKRVLRHQVVAEYDMEGNLETGKKILADIQSKIKPNLILAIGPWAFQVTATQGTNIPVVYAMVLNPPSLMPTGVKNITGASMNVPVETSIRLFKQLGSQIRRVGVVFSRSKTGYLVRRATQVGREQGVEIIEREINSPKEAIQALDSWQDDLHALWILPDEIVLTPEVVQYMVLFSYRRKIPLIGLSERQAQMGALLSLSFGSSEDIGRQAGELANNILEGQPPDRLPFTMARQVKLTVNLKAAEKLGIEIPKSLLGSANSIIQ